MSTAPIPFDPAARFVRIVHARHDGMIEFEFAVGEPQLFVEMVMPQKEFALFCHEQGVEPTHGGLPEMEPGTDAHEWDWTLRSARENHFRQEP